jgi:hypothetical protein
MLDEVSIAIATGAAGNVVAYMLNGPVDVLRTQVARIFRHGTEQERAEAVGRVGADAKALTEHKASEADLTERWIRLLASYLGAHPEARGDVEAFASSSINGKTTIIGSQNNWGSGAFIGGDNYGGIPSKG